MTLIIRSRANEPLRRRWWEEPLLEPIQVPLPQSVLDTLDDVAPEHAWLPLCIALIDRLRDLWSVAASGLYLDARPFTEEHLYQVMRRSLRALCPDPDADDSLANYLICIPDGLPPSGHLAVMSPEARTRQLADFQMVARGFIDEGIAQGIDPEPNRIGAALTDIDHRLGRILLQHNQTMLRHAEQLRLTPQMQDALRRRIRTQYETLYNSVSHYLAMSLEVVERLESIWLTLYPDTTALQRYAGDEHVYQGYRSILLRSVRADAGYGRLLSLITDLLPDLLPLTHELRASNPLFQEMPARFERLRNEVVAVAAALGESTIIDAPDEPDLDVTFEDLAYDWRKLEAHIKGQRSSMSPPPDLLPAATPVRKRSPGRPRGRVTFELASRAWWHLADELAPDSPTQEALAYELERRGYRIRPRTLRRYIAQWEASGRIFPGPQPADDVA